MHYTATSSELQGIDVEYWAEEIWSQIYKEFHNFLTSQNWQLPSTKKSYITHKQWIMSLCISFTSINLK